MKTATSAAMLIFFAACLLAFAVLVVSELARIVVARCAGIRIDRALVAIGFHGSRGGRIATLAAGPLAAYLAIALLAFIATCGPNYVDDRLFIAHAQEDFDAHGKLLPDDQVLSVERTLVSSARDIHRLIEGKPTVTVVVLRGGAPRHVVVTPKHTADGPRLGIALERSRHRDLARSARFALLYPVREMRYVLTDLGESILRPDAADAKDAVALASYRPQHWRDAFAMAGYYATYLLLLLFVVDLARLAILLRR